MCNLPLSLLSTIVAILANAMPGGSTTEPVPALASVDGLIRHIECTAPVLLEETGVPGVAVGLLHGGERVYLQGFGSADAAGRIPITPQTLFNVGSISKTVTAWAALRLAETDRLDLDTAIVDVFGRWPLARSAEPAFGPRAVTARLLLGHRAGVGAPSVPELLPTQPAVSLTEWLASDDVVLEAPPGTSWRYSGGGYALLELTLEHLSGLSFAHLVEKEVLDPLAMIRSTFDFPLGEADLAQPHEGGEPIPYRRYVGISAAGLYSSAEELLRFLSAHRASAAAVAGRSVVSPEAIRTMQSPVPGSWSRFGTQYGLGYDIWPLGDGSWSSGHRGSNFGWQAVLWMSDDARDGLVVLTNDTQGDAVYRPLFCEWARWLAGPSFGRYCSEPRGSCRAREPAVVDGEESADPIG